jgi:hypothetical protein
MTIQLRQEADVLLAGATPDLLCQSFDDSCSCHLAQTHRPEQTRKFHWIFSQRQGPMDSTQFLSTNEVKIPELIVPTCVSSWGDPVSCGALSPKECSDVRFVGFSSTPSSRVNAGVKMHRLAGVKVRHG